MSTVEKKIGLSLSFCVQDILRGDTQEEDIKEIISSTNATTPAEWDELIQIYRKTYWYDDPDKAEAIVRRLISADKIRQPRVEGGEAPNISREHWIDADKLSEWKTEQEAKRAEARR